MTKIRAYGSTIVARVDDDESKSEGGIILTTSAKDAPRWVSVISVGHEVSAHLQGARILIRKHAGQAFQFEGENLVALRPEDVIAQEW